MLSNSSSLLSVFWDLRALKAQQIAEEKTEPADSADYHDSVRGCDSHPEMGESGTTSGLRNRC